jgi:hypothetical protein
MNWSHRTGDAPLVRQYGTDFCPLAMWLLTVMYHAFPEVASKPLPPFFLA